MTTPKTRICYEEVLAFNAKGAIPRYAPVFLSGDNQVDVATLPTHRPIIGIALETKTAGQRIDVVRFNSIAPVIVDGAVTLGDFLVPSSTSGKLTSAGRLASPGSVLGIAMEAAGADGDTIGMLVAPELASMLGSVRLFVADGAITANRLVRVGSADGKVLQSATASPTDNIVGVALNTAIDGAIVAVALAGAIAKVTSGAVFSRGAPLTSDASGKAILSNPAAGTNTGIVGTALGAAGAADALVDVIISPGIRQG